MFKFNRTISTALLFALTLGNANAIIIPIDLQISGQVNFSVADSAEIVGNATQNATMTLTNAGASTVTTVANITPTGSNPLGDIDPGNFTFTDLGDGLGVAAIIDGEASSQADDFIFDIDFSLKNNSLTDTYQIFFELVYTNNVNAEGTGTFIDSEIALFNSVTSEVFVSDLTSDTVFFDQKNGTTLTTLGDALNDTGTFAFDFTLSAGASDSFSGLLKMDGSGFAANGTFDGDSEAFIRILLAENLTPPPPPVGVPEPSIVFLILSAVMGLIIKRRVTK